MEVAAALPALTEFRWVHLERVHNRRLLDLLLVTPGGMEEYSFAKSTDLEITIHVRMFVHLVALRIGIYS